MVRFLQSAQFGANRVLGDQLKRFAVGIAGFVYGLCITWISLLALSHLDWFRDPHKIARGCNELGKCLFP
jgi:hypothetical protein